MAQVGSGFDVSAAVYGTHIYTRFSPSELADALSAGDKSAASCPAPSSSVYGHGHARAPAVPTPLERISKCVEARGGWDADRGQLRLPSCFRLLMGDVCGGSSTPSMVRKVSCKWRNVYLGQHPCGLVRQQKWEVSTWNNIGVLALCFTK